MINISSIIDSYNINKSITSSYSYSPLHYVSEFKKLIDNNIHKEDIDVFVKLVLDGDIYKHIETHIDSVSTREGAKELFFKVFYSKTRSRFKEKQKLLELFPSVFSILESFKTYSHNLPWHNEAKPHAALPVMLQYIESLIIIDSVCKRIGEEFPDTPIFTIHDSILTVEGEEDKIKTIIEETFQKLVGSIPKIHMNIFSLSLEMS